MILKFIIAIYSISFISAYSIERRMGDVFQVALPLTAIGSTYYMEDKPGMKSFFKSYIITAGTTYLLKVTTKKQRPDGSNYMSFPSGHTSAAFSGASFVHFRYGFKYGAPLYILAAFTGYSRVYANKHYVEDVVAGAGLAILSSYYFTSPYGKKDYSVSINYSAPNKLVLLSICKQF